MIVFSNTTPLIALSSIHQLGILPRIFGKIHIVEAVLDECRWRQDCCTGVARF